jgi:yecA family protein
VRLEWVDTASRPALRVLAQAIWLAQLVHDLPRVEQLAAWGLQLNPNDNHGWRIVLAPQWIAQDRFGEALELMQRYPDDMPLMQHLRALALFALDRRQEAEALLRQAHAEYPLIMEFLLPDVMDAPPPEPGPGIAVGGTEEAWENRFGTRAAWVRTGALEWARSLDLRARPTAARKPARPKKKAQSQAPAADAFTQSHERTLRKSFPDYARVHGLLTAVAWSPDLVMPNQWLECMMALRAAAPANLKALNADMDALMRLYNTLNNRVLDTPPQEPAPVANALALADAGEADAFAWAAGFVQGAELTAGAWRRVGRALRTDKGAFAELFRLAARAPGAADGWRARNDEGQPMLAGLQDEPSAQETLRLALEDLWRVVAAARRHSAASPAAGR